ncbi:uL30 family ribosomal protein [Candidatus Micrarchaeota archaeon]|nr:uL30 family ribosomal protein [Candidatus Micrarchaeota archaeon]
MKLAVVRIRGVRKIAPRIKKTMELLKLEKPNHCVLVEDSPQMLGMLGKAKDYVTYGPVDEGTVLALLKKRGRKGQELLRTVMDEDNLKKAAKEIASGKKTADYAHPVFRLSPPSKGYGNIRAAYPNGELGKRTDMAPLLKRMM